MKTFQINEIYQRYAWNRTIASIKIKKLPTVGEGNPPPGAKPGGGGGGWLPPPPPKCKKKEGGGEYVMQE